MHTDLPQGSYLPLDDSCLSGMTWHCRICMIDPLVSSSVQCKLCQRDCKSHPHQISLQLYCQSSVQWHWKLSHLHSNHGHDFPVLLVASAIIPQVKAPQRKLHLLWDPGLVISDTTPCLLIWEFCSKVVVSDRDRSAARNPLSNTGSVASKQATSVTSATAATIVI